VHGTVINSPAWRPPSCDLADGVHHAAHAGRRHKDDESRGFGKLLFDLIVRPQAREGARPFGLRLSADTEWRWIGAASSEVDTPILQTRPWRGARPFITHSKCAWEPRPLPADRAELFPQSLHRRGFDTSSHLIACFRNERFRFHSIHPNSSMQ